MNLYYKKLLSTEQGDLNAISIQARLNLAEIKRFKEVLAKVEFPSKCLKDLRKRKSITTLYNETVNLSEKVPVTRINFRDYKFAKEYNNYRCLRDYIKRTYPKTFKALEIKDKINNNDRLKIKFRNRSMEFSGETLYTKNKKSLMLKSYERLRSVTSINSRTTKNFFCESKKHLPFLKNVLEYNKKKSYCLSTNDEENKIGNYFCEQFLSKINKNHKFLCIKNVRNFRNNILKNSSTKSNVTDGGVNENNNFINIVTDNSKLKSTLKTNSNDNAGFILTSNDNNEINNKFKSDCKSISIEKKFKRIKIKKIKLLY